MRKVWCQYCGEEAWEAHGRHAPILINNAPGKASDKITLHFHTEQGAATQEDWTLHRCQNIRYPKTPKLDAANEARRAVGLDPIEKRGDCA